jgi:hypothetical protein
MLACATVAAGCGTAAQNREARKLEGASVLSNTAPLEQRLIKPSEVAATSDRAGGRTFMQLWSLLQYGSVDRAELMFAPGLRNAIGTSLLAQALQTELLVWQGTKPRIVSANVSGPTAAIRFMARDEAGKLLPGSITLRGGEGHWSVVYFSLLDFALQRTVQQRVQARIEPLATKPSPEAARQGDRASAIQSIYLARLVREEAAERRP